VKSYLASDIFDLEISGNFPLDCTFHAKQPVPVELESPGVYMLFYKQELVFVGLAKAEQAIVRFQKQLSTITLRGKRVSFNNGELDPKSISLIFQNNFDAAINSNKRGFETSAKRIEYAAKNWNDFSKFDALKLKHFVFVWFPESIINGRTLVQFRNDFRTALKPLCNG
jgi:hypothetical protein